MGVDWYGDLDDGQEISGRLGFTLTVAEMLLSHYANGVDGSQGLLYSVRTFDQDTSLTVNPGWDDVTGLGSPNSGWLTAVG